MSKAEKYTPSEIESKWQKVWQERAIYKTSDTSQKEKFYVLDMFPYPSGEGLHVGHPKGYIATDIFSRMKRMQGKNVLHPMGFDAFGLPAEQYAIKNKVHPRLAVEKNVARYKEQLESLGFDYDWSREVNTTDPEFYKWTQWAFKQMFKKGLVSESYEPINWCPKDKTGLANEDVENGLCERCGTPVEKKSLRQWSIAITKYADRLLEDLDGLNWPEHIKESQRNWIGKSEGAEIDFAVDAFSENYNLKVFTTRPDTIFGVTYLAISADLAKAWTDAGWEATQEVKTFIEEVQAEQKKVETDYRTEVEKKGIETGLYAKSPLDGKQIPIWIANYVLPGYGTGALMAVPAHDQRDFEFAQKYNIEIQEVVRPYVVDHVNTPRPDMPTGVRENVHAIVHDTKTNKYLILRNKEHNWDTIVIGGIEEGENAIDAAIREVREETGYTDIRYVCTLGNPVQAGYFAKHKNENRLAISTAILFELSSETKVDIEDEGNEVLWIDAEDFVPGKMINSELSFWLERIALGKDSAYTGDGIIVNSQIWLNGLSVEDAKREVIKKLESLEEGRARTEYKLKDWVFARQRYWGEPFPIVFGDDNKPYVVADSELPVLLPQVENYEPTDTGESPLANIKDWVDVYGYINDDNEFVSADEKAVGETDKEIKLFRRETNTMPQWAGSSWYYLRFMDPTNTDQIFDGEKMKHFREVDMYVGGAEHATRHLIYARFWHKFLYDIGVVDYKEPFKRLASVGLILAEDGRKMSKRWGNVINPDDVVRSHGADALRLYEMFMGPFDQSAVWSTKNISGMSRFLERVWGLESKITEEATNEILFNKTIKKITEDIDGFKFNTAISQLMICSNAFEKDGLSRGQYEIFLKLLAPFAPHITEELWRNTLENQESIHLSEWRSALESQESIHVLGWPEADPNKLESDTMTISVQVNGKLRGTILVDRNATKEDIFELAKSEVNVAKWIENKDIKKEIYVEGKLVSFVI